MRNKIVLIAFLLFASSYFYACKKETLPDSSPLAEEDSRLYLRFRVGADSIIYNIGDSPYYALTNFTENPFSVRYFLFDVIKDSEPFVSNQFSIAIANHKLMSNDLPMVDLQQTIKKGSYTYQSNVGSSGNPLGLKNVSISFRKDLDFYVSNSILPTNNNVFEVLNAEDIIEEGVYYRKANIAFACTLFNINDQNDSIRIENGRGSVVFSGK